MLPYKLLMGVTAGGIGGIVTVLGELRDELGFSGTGIGIMVASGFVAAFLSQVTLARLADVGHSRVMATVGIALSSIAHADDGLRRRPGVVDTEQGCAGVRRRADPSGSTQGRFGARSGPSGREPRPDGGGRDHRIHFRAHPDCPAGVGRRDPVALRRVRGRHAAVPAGGDATSARPRPARHLGPGDIVRSPERQAPAGRVDHRRWLLHDDRRLGSRAARDVRRPGRGCCPDRHHLHDGCTADHAGGHSGGTGWPTGWDRCG